MLFFSNHVDFTFPIFDETKLPITTTQIYARITDLKVSGDMEMLAQKLDVPNRTASR